jgi:hypothetical protein
MASLAEVVRSEMLVPCVDLPFPLIRYPTVKREYLLLEGFRQGAMLLIIDLVKFFEQAHMDDTRFEEVGPGARVRVGGIGELHPVGKVHLLLVVLRDVFPAPHQVLVEFLVLLGGQIAMDIRIRVFHQRMLDQVAAVEEVAPVWSSHDAALHYAEMPVIADQGTISFAALGGLFFDHCLDRLGPLIFAVVCIWVKEFLIMKIIRFG